MFLQRRIFGYGLRISTPHTKVAKKIFISTCFVTPRNTAPQDFPRGRLANNLFPNQKFAYITINEFPSIPDNFTLGEKFDTTIKAIVNVNGVDALLDFDISAQLSFINPFYSDERLEIKGISEFYWSDFNMDTPKSGFFTLQDKVDVQISILADSLVVRY